MNMKHNSEERMKPSQLAQYLAVAIRARHPVLIVGAPGIGKSDIVEQAAHDAGADLLISHPAVADPTDAKGLPFAAPDADHATFLPFGELAAACRAERPTVWFLDDLGQALPAVQASFMQLLLARRIGEHVLPDCVTFVAATNRRTDRAGVSGILEPVKSRFASIVHLEADVDEWCEWALGPGDMPPELVAFIRFRPDLLCDFQPTADLTNSPVPRTWANAGKAIKLRLTPDLEPLIIAGAVGEGPASELTGFLRMFRSLPSIEGILKDPDNAPIPDDPSALVAVATALGSRATPANFDKLARYAQRLADSEHGEFAALLIRDAVRRDDKVAETKAFTDLATGDLGALIGGAA